ncbi:MAG TPA: hypothetical protein VK403_03735 [Allosphingosinicella sp.]|nr:hypothetical protein [Allosphingosinicella sp.]
MRIVIAIPVHRQMEADFGVCLAGLTMHTVRFAPHIDLAVQRVSSSILAQARTRLWRWAEQNQAQYILFADADQTFPPDGLLRLLSHNLPAVGANYPARTPDVMVSTGWDLQGRPLKHPRPGDGVEEVLHLGLGLCLIKVPEVSAALAAQAEREGRSTYYPLFAALPDPDGARHPNGDDVFIGEDVYFFDKLRAAGIKLHVDHDLSLQVSHIADIHLAFPD